MQHQLPLFPSSMRAMDLGSIPRRRAPLCYSLLHGKLTIYSLDWPFMITCVQALLDVYTIQREIGQLDNVRIGLVGDLANGRTARSLAYLMSMYTGVKIYFVAPEVVRMGDDIKEFLDSRNISWEEADDLSQVYACLLARLEAAIACAMTVHSCSTLLSQVAAEVDVLYQTRIQKERFQVRLC